MKALRAVSLLLVVADSTELRAQCKIGASNQRQSIGQRSRREVNGREPEVTLLGRKNSVEKRRP